MFFKKKKETQLYSPANGKIINLEQVNDPVFSKKLMGEGFAVTPIDSAINSPVEGVITSIFPTKHALGIKTKYDLDILIHIGIDTVELNGAPFKFYVSAGEKVTPQTHIADVDLNILEERNKEKEIMVTITNMDIVKKFDFTSLNSQTSGTPIAVVYQ